MPGIKLRIKNVARKILYGYKADSETYLNYYRKNGASIGEGCVVFEPTNTMIDVSRPYLIQIGNNVQILKGVTILTHGYDWAVLKGKYGDVLGNARPVKIGNNVFIGRNATILGDVEIGNNVIIGAGSIVTHNIPDDCVVAGVPARIMSTIEEYYIKRKQKQVQEAQNMAQAYFKAFHKIPPKEEFREFFWLFERRKSRVDVGKFDDVMKLAGNYEESYHTFLNTAPFFDGYDEFIKSCNFEEKIDERE